MKPLDLLMPGSRLAALFFLLFLVLPGCDSVIPPPSQPGTSNIVYMWIGADADAFTWCGLNFPGCPYGDANFGRNGTLPVAFTELDLKRTYLHFDLPTVPEGTQVEEAYLELYHGGRNEDGQTDDIDLPVAMVPTAWDPLTITHNNQPFVSTPPGFTSINLKSQAWSGTPNIRADVGGMFANPSINNGFAVFWRTPLPPIEKGFYGINDFRRTRTDLWLSPRLLVKVVLPEGMSASDISINPLLSTSDLNPPGTGPILMVSTVSGGNDWPSAWNVTRGQ